LYAPLAGEAAVHSQRKKRPIASAAPSPLFQHFPERLTEDFQQPPAENHEYGDTIKAFDELQRAVLIGEPGVGKTTALYKLAQQLAEQAREDPDTLIPVMIPLCEWLVPEQNLHDVHGGSDG